MSASPAEPASTTAARDSFAEVVPCRIRQGGLITRRGNAVAGPDRDGWRGAEGERDRSGARRLPASRAAGKYAFRPPQGCKRTAARAGPQRRSTSASPARLDALETAAGANGDQTGLPVPGPPPDRRGRRRLPDRVPGSARLPSDGETIEAAITNGADALRSWIDTAREFGDTIPPPSRPSDDAYSGRWNMRVPRSLHRRLAERAKAEGVSLNTLAVTLLAEGLGRRGRDDDQRRRDRQTALHGCRSRADHRPAPQRGHRRALGALDQPRGDCRPDHRQAARRGRGGAGGSAAGAGRCQPKAGPLRVRSPWHQIVPLSTYKRSSAGITDEDGS